MESSSNKAEGITNLLLKIVFPLAFPLAGAFLCDLITSRANRHSGFTGSLGSICKEEEEEEMASPRRATRRLARTGSVCSTAGTLVISELARQAASNAEDVMVVEATGNSSEAAADIIKQLQDDQRMAADEIASLKLMVSALEDRACSMDSQFNEYCDMKEQESAYQKMQIMCLGMKLELLESQNQRLEAAAAEISAAAEEFAAMKGKLDGLQSKLKKITKRSKRDSDAFGVKILALDAKQSQMARRCEEFEQAMEEMKQLLEQKAAANNENVEVVVERSLRNLSSGRDLVDGLEALRGRWASGMEEMIYLGWITAWLQHDLMLVVDDDDGGGSTYGGGEDVGGSACDDAAADDDRKRKGVHPPEDEEKKKGETMVAAAAPSNEVVLRKAGSASSASSSGSSSGGPRRSVEVEPPASSCLGFAAAGGCASSSRDGGAGGWSIGRPRLLRKLRGWAAAGGKAGDRGGKARCRIAGPCCQK